MTRTIDHALHLALGVLLLAAGLGGCFGGSEFGMGGGGWNTPGTRPADSPTQPTAISPDDGVTGVWQTDPAYSPTGTTLLPSASGEGFDVVDEVCGAVEDPGYASRFLTSMYRDVALSEDGRLAYLVDGSHLWVLDVSDAEAPERLAIEQLEGHPIAVQWTPERLWVASLDAGLRGYGLDVHGLPVVSDVVVTLAEHARVMDVAAANGKLFAALGADGLAAVALTDGQPAVTHFPAAPYAASVFADDERVLVASCERVWAYAQADDTLWRETDFAVPFGNAKSAELVDDIIYVSAGDALLAFRLDNPVMYLGYYADDAPGFYINQTVAGGGHLYLAAGDQSVRAVSIDDMPLEEGVPVTPEQPATTLEEAIQAEQIDIADVTVHQVPVDPIGVGLHGDRLYALGNFRYLGERTVEVFDVTVPSWLKLAGSYIEPNLGVGISLMGDSLVVHGADGEHRVVETGHAPALTGSFTHEPTHRGTVSGDADLYLYGEGAVVRARQQGGTVLVDDLTPTRVDAHSVALAGDRAFVSDAVTDAILTVDRASGELLGSTAAKDGFLGDAELFIDGARMLAYDRVLGDVRVYDLAGAAPVEVGRTYVGLCEAYDLADFYSVAIEAQAKFLAGPDGRVALLCPRRESGQAELVWLAVDAAGAPELTQRLTLPAASFADAVLTDELLVLVSFDAERYVSTLTACHPDSGAVLEETSFTGHANALLHTAKQFYVIDGDFGLRVFDARLAATSSEPLAL